MANGDGGPFGEKPKCPKSDRDDGDTTVNG